MIPKHIPHKYINIWSINIANENIFDYFIDLIKCIVRCLFTINTSNFYMHREYAFQKTKTFHRHLNVDICKMF